MGKEDGYHDKRAGDLDKVNHVVSDREMNSLARSPHPYDLLYTGRMRRGL